MSLVTKHDESFGDMLLGYFINFIEIIPYIYEFVVVTGFITVALYTFYYIYEHRYKRLTLETKNDVIELQDIKNCNRALIQEQSILCHKQMLHDLEYAANKCYDTFYGLKCIDIIVYCPQLLNVKCSLSGLTPFHRICFNDCTHLIAFALAKGANPFITAVSGENALCMSVYHFLNNPTKNDFSSLEMLQNTGCTFGAGNKWYDCLLKMAYYKNHIKLVEWLILHQVPSYEISRCSSMPPILQNYKFN